jgi:hypothetical protein
LIASIQRAHSNGDRASDLVGCRFTASSANLERARWRVCTLHPNYEVSENGAVRNRKTGRLLKPWHAGAGYLYVALGDRVKTGVHRLVALAFLGPPPSLKHEVAHNDGNRRNNCATNLRWATHAENMADMRKHGTTYAHWRGRTPPNAKLQPHQVAEVRRRVQAGALRKCVAAELGVSKATIDHIVTGRTWSKAP